MQVIIIMGSPSDAEFTKKITRSRYLTRKTCTTSSRPAKLHGPRRRRFL